jgi:hypothetical protein
VTIYFGLFMILTALWGGVRSSAAARQAAYWFTFAVLFIFVAFRWEVGCDWSGYLNQYEIARYMIFDWTISEPLWWLMLGQVQEYGLDYEWVNVLSAVFFFAGTHVLARRQPDALAYLVLLFPVLMVNMAMSGLRQAIAVGFVSAAFVAFADRNLIRFLLPVLLASQFHSSAAVFLLLAPLVGGNYSRKRLVLGILLGIPGMIALASADAAETAATRYIGTNLNAAGALFRVGFVGLSGLIFLCYTPYQNWLVVGG